ncbi:MAG TPA: GNAT family N-acetyltransferase [Pirellulaceae bacterium]|nr:GNAT family N-acetyltransferase [Pirellulaceae bacterium]
MNASLQATTHVVELNDIDQLMSYRDDWTRLLAETPDACFFQTLEWLAVYWRHFGRDQRLRTLVVYHDDRIVGILPLAIRTTPTRGGAMRTIGYPLDSWGTRYGPIGTNSRAILSAGLRHVLETDRDWNVLELDGVSGDRVAGATSAFEELGVWPQVFACDQISLVDLTRSWDEYWISLAGKHRNNVRRAEKKLATLGPVTMFHYRSQEGDAPGPRWDLYDTCETIAGQSWQGSSATGTTLTHERVRQFLRDVHEVATGMRAVAIHLLAIDGEPVAFAYNYVFQGSEFGLRIGYDPKFKSGRPGTVLIHRMLQDVFIGDRRQFDFGEGDSRYKHDWRTAALPSFRICHYAKTSLRAQALRWKRHWSGDRVKAIQGRFV